MKTTGIILAAAFLASVFLAGCKQRDAAPGTNGPRGDVSEVPAPEPAPETRAAVGGTGEKPLPKLVPVKSFSERSIEKFNFFRSTAPAPGGISGSSDTNDKAAPFPVAQPEVIQPPGAIPPKKLAGN